jgi:NAD kinase
MNTKPYTTKPIKVALVTEHKEKAIALLCGYGNAFEVVEENPKVVISYGGDGTFLKSEHMYPGVPKLYLKYSRVGKLAIKKTNATILKRLLKREYIIKEKNKLEITFQNRTLVAMAEALIHNKNPRTAIRCKVYVNRKLIHPEDVIGDGVLVVTQIGSTGYYRSITRSYFESDEHIGIAFNNSTEHIDHRVIDKKHGVTIKVTRGIAQVFADNQEECFELDSGDVLTVRLAKQSMKIIHIA